MFYLTSKFHDNHVNTVGFMEPPPPPPPQAQKLQKSPGRIGLAFGVEKIWLRRFSLRRYSLRCHADY